MQCRNTTLNHYSSVGNDTQLQTEMPPREAPLRVASPTSPETTGFANSGVEGINILLRSNLNSESHYYFNIIVSLIMQGTHPLSHTFMLLHYLYVAAINNGKNNKRGTHPLPHFGSIQFNNNVVFTRASAGNNNVAFNATKQFRQGTHPLPHVAFNAAL